MSQNYEKEFDALIEHLKNHLNIPDLEKEDENTCTIVSDDILISLINDRGNLVFATNFGTLHEYNKQAKIKDYLLNANYLFYQTNGATFGINKESGIISFCYQKPLDSLTNENFIEILDIFVMTIDFFVEQIKTIEQSNDQTADNVNISESFSEAETVTTNWQKV